jgi:hypothetical protein
MGRIEAEVRGSAWVMSSHGVTPRVMSDLPLKTDIRERELQVRCFGEPSVRDLASHYVRRLIANQLNCFSVFGIV